LSIKTPAGKTDRGFFISTTKSL